MHVPLVSTLHRSLVCEPWEVLACQARLLFLESPAKSWRALSADLSWAALQDAPRANPSPVRLDATPAALCSPSSELRALGGAVSLPGKGSLLFLWYT